MCEPATPSQRRKTDNQVATNHSERRVQSGKVDRQVLQGVLQAQRKPVKTLV